MLIRSFSPQERWDSKPADEPMRIALLVSAGTSDNPAEDMLSLDATMLKSSTLNEKVNFEPLSSSDSREIVPP